MEHATLFAKDWLAAGPDAIAENLIEGPKRKFFNGLESAIAVMAGLVPAIYAVVQTKRLSMGISGLRHRPLARRRFATGV